MPYVLVLEDNQDLREILIEFLEGYGLRCLSAASAHQALSALTGQPDIGCAVLDLILPQGGIQEVIEECQRRSLPCIVTTGLDQGTARTVCPQNIPVLIKPVDLWELAGMLRELLGHTSCKSGFRPIPKGL